VKDRFEDLHRKLRNGFFLSSMVGITDGVFCSQRSEGCVMVQMGAYLAEPPSYGKARYALPPKPDECIAFLAEECKKVKSVASVFTCLNLATIKLKWGLEAAKCFFEAGGDFLELNIHGGTEYYLRLGRLRAMVLPENRDELFKWVEALTKLEIPLIVKFREGVIDDYSPVLEKIMDLKIFGVHFNVRDDNTKKPDFEFVRNVKGKYPLFLLVSGYVRSAVDAKMLFESGADMVGIAEPIVRDPKYIHKIVKEFKARYDL